MTLPQHPLTETARLFPQIGPFRATPSRSLGRLLLIWQARAADRVRLAGLDERDLRDMGMTRADARREAAKPFWRA